MTAQLDQTAPERAACLVNAIVFDLPEPAGEARFLAASVALRSASAAIPAESLMLTAAAETFAAMAQVEAKQGNP